MDRMFIRDLKVNCIIGTRPSERRRKQAIQVNVELECDLARAGRSDDLDDTVNYKSLSERIVRMAVGSRFFLIEKLAAAVAEICLGDAGVRAVVVTIEKPRALPNARCAAVQIRRARTGK